MRSTPSAPRYPLPYAEDLFLTHEAEHDDSSAADAFRHPAPQTPQTLVENPPRPRHRRLLLLPTLLSSMGKSFILSQVNNRIAGTVNADSISLGWFSGASVRNLSVKDPDGKVILTVPTADTGLSLSNALLSSTRHLDIVIRADNATLIATPDGTNNLSRAFGPKSSPAATAAIPTSAPAPQAAAPASESPAKPMSVGNLIATFDIQITHITCESPNAPTLSIDNTSLKGNLNTISGDTKLTLAATAKSADGKPTALSADVAGNFFTNGTLKPLGEFTGNGQATVHALDLAAVSPLLATAGLPLQLTGTLDATAKLDQTAGKPSVNADLTLAQLTATGPALDGDILKRDQVKGTLQATLNGDSVDLQQLALTTQSLSAKINGTLQTSPTAAAPKQPLTIAAMVDVTELKKQLPHLLGNIPDTTATVNFTGQADAAKKILTITANSSIAEKDPATGLGNTIAFTAGSVLSWGNGNNNLTLPITYDLTRAQQILAKNLPTGTILSGIRTMTLHITGPLANAPGLAALQHLSIDPATFGYDRIFCKGFDLSKAAVGISMKSGILTLAPSNLPANQGTIHLAGRVDCTQTPAAFILDKSPQGTQLVDNVSLNHEIAAGPLAFLPISWGGDKNNPTLGTVTGKLNVNLDQALIPLDSAAFKQKGSTSGKISIDNLTTDAPFFAQIFGALGSVLQLAHVNSAVQGASISNGVFALTNGKVTYQNLTIGAAQFNMNFSGSVGLDSSIAMNMNLTVAALNVPIPIGIGGTTDKPRITVSDRGIGKNIGNVIQNAVPKDLGKNIGDLFKKH
jgi:hypothetical protein